MNIDSNFGAQFITTQLNSVGSVNGEDGLCEIVH